MKQNFKNLDEFKMTKQEMNSIRGGYDPIICNALQALANNKDVTKNWTSKDWDNWAANYSEHCLDAPAQPF